MKRRLSKTGETIVETLVSMLIVSLTFLFLAGAIVKSAELNNRIKTTQGEFRVVTSGDSVGSGASFENPRNGTIKLDNGGTLHVTVYRAYAGEDRDKHPIYYYYYTRSGE